MDCKVCMKQGMLPSCPFCKRKASTHKTKKQKLKDEAFRERIRLNQLAYTNFKKINAAGSGLESFDTEIKDTIGDWRKS